MVESSFFAVFFIKKIKKRGSLGKRPADFTRSFFYFFILLVAQLVLRTDAIPSSRVFIRYALFAITFFKIKPFISVVDKIFYYLTVIV